MLDRNGKTVEIGDRVCYSHLLAEWDWDSKLGDHGKVIDITFIGGKEYAWIWRDGSTTGTISRSSERIELEE